MLKVQNISFSYSKNKLVLDNFNFNIKEGEHLCVMGESGCGKSTLLKAIYGLLDLKKGAIFWKDHQILGPEFHLVPGMDFFKYVAQDFDLMPYISVSENIKKFLSRFYPEESEKRTQELLEVIEMKAFENTKVKNLSGGQKQRVAIARALANEPELLLLDEPFGQIDNFKKNSLRRKLFAYLKEKNIACIVNDSPKETYNNPKEKYIAALFNDVNEIIVNGESVLLYPHQIKIVTNSKLAARVLNSYFKGAFWLIEVEFENQIVFLNHVSEIETNTNINISVLS